MSTPPTPGRGGRWQQPNTQQGAFNTPSNRGRGPRQQQGRGAQNARQPAARGRGGPQRGGFTGGRGRGSTIQVPQMTGSNFAVRPGLQQSQFPGSIPSAPTQQVVMVPNHLLQQAVSPYPFFNQNQNMVATQGGMMPQFQQAAFLHPQQVAMLQQQQQQRLLAQRQQQGLLQQQQRTQGANQQNQPQQSSNQPNQRTGKQAPTQQTSSPPQQATQPNQMNANQMQTQNQPAPNQPSATPIHPMNQQQQQFYVMPNYGHAQQFYVRQQPMVNAAMMANPAQAQILQQQIIQQQRALQQQQLLQRQQALQQQQQQQQQPGKDDPQKQQTQQTNYMQIQNPGMYTQQVRMGGPTVPMAAMQQPNTGATQPWMVYQQQQLQQQKQQMQAASRPNTQPAAPTVTQPSRPPTGMTQTQTQDTAKDKTKQAEMIEKFKAAANAETSAKPTSPTLPEKKGTPLSAKAAEFVPGSWGDSAPAVSQPPSEINKKDPTQTTQAVPIIPPTVVPTIGVPAENVKSPAPAWKSPQPSQPPPSATKNAGVEAEAMVLGMFDPSEMKKVQSANDVGPEEMAKLVSENQRLEPDVSDIVSEDINDKEENSSPRSTTLSLGPESETVDDENTTTEGEEKKEIEAPLDVENQIYTIAQLIKLAKDPENKELHEVLQQAKYNSIKAHSCAAVHEIIDSSKMTRSKRRNANFQGGSGMSRDIFGTKKAKKKTPKGKQRHHQKGKYDNYPPLLRVEPLHKDMNNSWWATHRQKNSPLDCIRKKSLELLNKLTLENKSSICGKFTEHICTQVKSTDECNVVVSTIFQKSCAESKFSNLYADLCHVVQSSLSGVKPNLERESNPDTVEDNEDMKGLFRRSIINLCQLNFNRRLSVDPIEGSEEEILAQLDNTKRKMMGNIKFIGDLFKHKLIHESIVHHIIAKLLTPRDKDYDSNSISRRKLDDQLEGCCRLLQTVGKQIDVPKAKEWIDQYFDYMVHYQKNAQNRIVFMVLEIGELRSNKWIPRREVETVKLKEEVRKQFEREQMEKQRGPRKGKHGVKVSSKRPSGSNRRDNTIRGSSTSGNAWARGRTPSSAPPNSKKKGSQDIRGGSYSVRSPNVSRPPSSAPRPSAAPKAINMQELQKEWDEFGNSKRIPEKELDKFLKKGGANGAAQKARWTVFCKHFVCNAQKATQRQMMTSLRYFVRGDKVQPQMLLQCMAQLALQIETLSDAFDVPKAAEYYGYLISELVVTNRISPEDVVRKYCPQNTAKETTLNLFMSGVLRELSTLDDPDGSAFVQQHASTLKQGFRLEPKDNGKPAKRKQIPTAEELPIIEVVLGENAV